MTDTNERLMDALSSVVDYYVDSYSFVSDGGCHTPTESERLLIEDAIQGLLVDDEFIASFLAPHREGFAATMKERDDLASMVKRILYATRGSVDKQTVEWRTSADEYLRRKGMYTVLRAMR